MTEDGFMLGIQEGARRGTHDAIAGKQETLTVPYEFCLILPKYQEGYETGYKVAFRETAEKIKSHRMDLLRDAKEFSRQPEQRSDLERDEDLER